MKKENKIIMVALIILGIGFSIMSYAIFELDGIKSQPVAILFISGIIIGISLGIVFSMPSKKKSQEEHNNKEVSHE